MKKTDKTALTAATFAAALNIVPMGASAYDPAEEQIQDVYGPPVYFETTSVEEIVPQPDYGPMPAWTTETTAVPEETTTDVTEIVPQPTYGPPIPTGDMNFDGKVDTFDLISMRKLFSKTNYSEYYDRAADIVSKFIKKCGVAECKAKLEELLAKSNGKTVNFKQLPHKSDWEGRYNEVVDADFIRKILERI